MQTFLTIPEKLAVTSVDAEAHPLVGALARECGSELVALSLWLLAERAAGQASQHAGLLATLPVRADSWRDVGLGAAIWGAGRQAHRSGAASKRVHGLRVRDGLSGR